MKFIEMILYTSNVWLEMPPDKGGCAVCWKVDNVGKVSVASTVILLKETAGLGIISS
jgi:hypothetical protein